MPERLHPGVFVEEVSLRDRVVVGLPTTHTAFVGRFEKGPVAEPHKVTSAGEMIDLFGRPGSSFPAAQAVWQYFLGGGAVAWVVRIAEPAAGSELAPVDFGLEPGASAAATGMFALDDAVLFNQLAMPDMAHLDLADWNTVFTRASELCERRRAFLIADAPVSAADSSDPVDAQIASLVAWFRASAGPTTSHAMLCVPRLVVNDAFGGGTFETETSGAVAGLIVRTDSHRGVWKAPAGVEATLRGVEGLQLEADDRQLGRFNEAGLVSLRTLPGSGVVSWGARTTAGGDQGFSEWKYVPVRRLANHILGSVEAGLRWVVFEPNDEPLWAAIRSSVGDFFEQLFREGAFTGSRSNDAYFVKCDRETTTQADVESGVCNVVLGFAPLKPAEFVVLSLQFAVASDE